MTQPNPPTLSSRSNKGKISLPIREAGRQRYCDIQPCPPDGYVSAKPLSAVHVLFIGLDDGQSGCQHLWELATVDQLGQYWRERVVCLPASIGSANGPIERLRQSQPLRPAADRSPGRDL